MAVVSGGSCREVATHSGNWSGYVSGKVLAVGVTNLYQSKEAGHAWIDEYIDKMIAAVMAPR